MVNHITGLHHLTAIATDAQQNIDFYAGLLGLRLVKKTVNFDDPSAYHLYYGDESGTPGSIVTFFYWPGAARGRVGAGQTTAITFSVSSASLPFWQQRLELNHVSIQRRRVFDEELLAFGDPDGIPVEIIAVKGDARIGWNGAGIPVEHALRGLHTAQLTVRDAGPTEKLFTDVMGYRLVRRVGNRARFDAGPGGPGRGVDVIADATSPRGSGGAGTIHHIAYRVSDDAAQLELKDRIAAAGLSVSDVRDRDYFHSIYYREPGGILFEIATDVPGFAVDEPASSLGTALMLPKQIEPLRSRIEKILPPLQTARTYSSAGVDAASSPV